MGNCANNCGCTPEESARLGIDTNQIRNSIKDQEMMMNGGYYGQNQYPRPSRSDMVNQRNSVQRQDNGIYQMDQQQMKMMGKNPAFANAGYTQQQMNQNQGYGQQNP